MDATLYAHLQAQEAPRIWFAVEVAFPERTVRVCSGGVISFDGRDFTVEDPVYGPLYRVSPVSDGTEDQAARAEIEFRPTGSGTADEYWLDDDGEVVTDDADEPILLTIERSFLEHALRAGTQLSPVTIWWGAVDRETGLVVGEPEGVFHCLTDVPSVVISEQAWPLTFDCMSILDYALQADEGFRLNGAFHKSVWPGELGCDFVTSAGQMVYWGETRPSAITFRAGGAFRRWTGQ